MSVKLNLDYHIDFIEINDKIYQILIGKHAKGNDTIINIAKKAHQNNLWFHFDKISSPHIILFNGNDQIEKRYLYQIANKLWEYRNAPKNTKVIYTEIKNISLTEIPGTVSTKNLKILIKM